MSIPNNILSVKIGKELFAFDGFDIEQILRVPAITSVPLTQSGIRGVASISGRTVTIVDMAIVLASGSIDEKQTDARVLTVKYNDVEYGILVDEVLEMETVHEDNYEVSTKEDSKISGLYKKEEEIYKVISISTSIKSLTLVDYKPVQLAKFDDKDNSKDKNSSSQIADNSTKRCIFLTLGNENFAISLEIAREIIFIPENITPISEAGHGVMGMITLRNELITALDLKKLINVPAKNNNCEIENKENRLLILSYQGKSLALLVDSISEVKDIPLKDTETLPERFIDSKIESIYKAQDQIVSIISSSYLKEKINEFTIEEELTNSGNDEESTDKKGDDTTMNEVAAFQINNEEFALEIQDVQEIIKFTEVTPIPEAPKFVDGVINLRGLVIPIVSLPERLGFKKQINSKSKILICNIEEEKIGLLVDDVNEIMFIDDKNVSKSSSEDSLFSEVITLDDGKRIILKLRISEVLDDKTLESIKMIDVEV